MKIVKVEHSPLPAIKSITDTQLLFNRSEHKALQKAAEILYNAEKKIIEYYAGEYDNTLSIADFNEGLEFEFPSPGRIQNFIDNEIIINCLN